jgi:hypothetical protein
LQLWRGDDNDDDIDMSWESIREGIIASAAVTVGYYELKQHKIWLEEDCSQLMRRRNQAKLQLLQNTRQINGMT